MQAKLTGVGKGKAVWKVDDRPKRSQAELQLEGEKLPPNTALAVTIGDDAGFMVLTDALGRYHLAQHYVGSDRPSIAIGDAVAVTNGSGAVLQTRVMQLK